MDRRSLSGAVKPEAGGQLERRDWHGAGSAVTTNRRSLLIPAAPAERFGVGGLLSIGFFGVAPFAVHFEQRVAGLIIDPADLFLLPAIASVWIFRAPSSTHTPLPLRRTFYLYLMLTAAAYASSVYALGYLSDPVRAGYQFYRYAWRPALVFPITYFLMQAQKPRTLPILILTLILVADANALAGIWQGRHGLSPSGLFGAIGHWNGLASSVLVPAFIALGVAASLPRGGWRRFAYASFTLLVVLLWYAGSRGGAVAFLVGVAAYLAIGQARLKIIGNAAIVLVVVLSVYPNFGQRSGIRARFLEATHGTATENLQWRLTERWPYFLERALDNPWLGTGTEVDLRFGDEANTPHNGYLSIAVKSGLPALGLFVCFLAFTLIRSATVASRGLNAFERGIGAGVFAATVAVATHNLVDFTFDQGSTGYLLWMASGLVASLPVGDMRKPGPELRRVQHLANTNATESLGKCGN